MSNTLTQKFLDKQRKLNRELHGANDMIKTRIDYIVATICEVYELSHIEEDYWDFNCDTDFLSQEHDVFTKVINIRIFSLDTDYPKGYSYTLENNATFTICELQYNWLFEDFENELIEARKRWLANEALKEKEIETKLLALTNRFTKEEIDFLIEHYKKIEPDNRESLWAEVRLPWSK